MRLIPSRCARARATIQRLPPFVTDITCVRHRRPDVGLSTLVKLRGLPESRGIDICSLGVTILGKWATMLGNWRCARSLLSIELAFGQKTLDCHAMDVVASRGCGVKKWRCWSA